MKSHLIPVLPSAIALLGALLACGPVYADKDSGGNGHGKSDKHEQHSDDYRGGDRHDGHDDDDDHDHDRDGNRHDDYHSGGQHYFTDQHRVVVHQYYVDEFNRGHCPPGLKKKHNGCMPPGQAKHWSRGQPLPRDVVYYPLPPAVVVNLGPPPPGAQYVRVANDVLLIAIGTGMVLDALGDLSAM